MVREHHHFVRLPAPVHLLADNRHNIFINSFNGLFFLLSLPVVPAFIGAST
jgi:hypothetical protein